MSREAAHWEGNWRRAFVTGYAIIVLMLTAVWAFFLVGPVSQAMEDRQREGLLSVANAAEVALSSSELPAEVVLDRIAASDRLRLTLIARDGSVLAESIETSGMLNHAERPEVIAALAGEQGFDRRTSETDGIEYLYVAIPSSARTGGAVLRVSMPVTQAHAAVRRFRWTSFALLSAASLLAVAIAWLSFSRAAGPVRRMERVRTDFVANASHELKTPVAGIRLLSESITQAATAGDDASVVEFAERLERESHRLQSLVTDLMDLSRLEDSDGHGTSRAQESCDLASVVAMSYQAHQTRAQAKGLALLLEDATTGIEGVRVSLSPTNATLLVDNLVDNALTYTEEGSVTLRLRREGETVIFEVEDTGIGIPLADQDRIFERFYRVDTARSREAGGTGLGLSLVRHAVRRGGGSIVLESELGKGSTFRVSLPLAE